MASYASNMNVNAIAEQNTATPSYTLFNAGSVALATILGGPVPGTILMAINYRRMGQAQNAVLSVLAGIGAMAFAMLLGAYVPQIPPICISIGVFSGLWRTAETLQGATIGHHVNQGGRLGSKWAAFGLGMVFLAAIVLVVVLAAQNAPRS